MSYRNRWAYYMSVPVFIVLMLAAMVGILVTSVSLILVPLGFITLLFILCAAFKSVRRWCVKVYGSWSRFRQRLIAAAETC